MRRSALILALGALLFPAAAQAQRFTVNAGGFNVQRRVYLQGSVLEQTGVWIGAGGFGRKGRTRDPPKFAPSESSVAGNRRSCRQPFWLRSRRSRVFKRVGQSRVKSRPYCRQKSRRTKILLGPTSRRCEP